MRFFRPLPIFLAGTVCLLSLACGGETAVSSESEATEEAAAAPQRLSPHESVSGTVGEANLSVTYGRPYKKGREIFGGLVPLDAV